MAEQQNQKPEDDSILSTISVFVVILGLIAAFSYPNVSRQWERSGILKKVRRGQILTVSEIQFAEQDSDIRKKFSPAAEILPQFTTAAETDGLIVNRLIIYCHDQKNQPSRLELLVVGNDWLTTKTVIETEGLKEILVIHRPYSVDSDTIYPVVNIPRDWVSCLQVVSVR